MVTSSMNSRPTSIELAYRANPSVSQLYPASCAQPSGGWSYQ